MGVLGNLFNLGARIKRIENGKGIRERCKRF